MVIRDDKEYKNIIIQLNLKKNTTTVVSNFSTWENLGLIMEALGATMQQCIREGKRKEKVHKAVREYLSKVTKAYA